MKKLWCYSFFNNEILQDEFEEKPKSYKFIKRPCGFNSMVLKTNVNRVSGDFAFAETKEILIKIINEKFDDDIRLCEAKIKKIEEKKKLLNEKYS